MLIYRNFNYDFLNTLNNVAKNKDINILIIGADLLLPFLQNIYPWTLGLSRPHAGQRIKGV